MQVDKLNLTAEQRELEGALSGMVPIAAGMDRDAMMFAAGRASVSRPVVWPWRVAACVGMLLSVGLGVMGMRGAVPQAGEVVKAVPTAVTGNGGNVAAAVVTDGGGVFEAVQESSPWSYYTLRNEALNWGVNVLPTAPNGGAGAAVVKEERAGKGLSFRQFIFNAGGRS